MVTLAAVSAVLVGCGGGSESEREQVSSTARRYFAALASGNGKEVCSLATEQAKRELLGGETRTTRCPERFRLLYEGVIREFREAHRSDPLGELRKVKVDVVALSGRNATARVTLPAGNVTDVPLSKTAVGWRVSGEARCVPVAKATCQSSL
jgi:hypothetical protein